MGTRLDGRNTVHHVEATGPHGDHLDLLVTARKRHRGSVRVLWDPDETVEPHFPPEMPWAMLGIGAAIVVAIVLGGWFLLG
jgi:hypothetical protein